MFLKSTGRHGRFAIGVVVICGLSVLVLLIWQQVSVQSPSLSLELPPFHSEIQSESIREKAASSSVQPIPLAAAASATEQSAVVVNSTTPNKPITQRQWSILAQAEIIKSLPASPDNSHPAPTTSPAPAATESPNQAELRPTDNQPAATLAFTPAAQDPTPAPSSNESMRESIDNPASPALPALNKEGVIDVIKDWAEAWSQQDIDRYLNFYSLSFTPSKGVTRDVWRQQRQQRIDYPQWIKVETSLYDLQELSKTTASIRFLQHYQSPTLDDRIFKIIGLKLEGDDWKIMSERVTKP